MLSLRRFFAQPSLLLLLIRHHSASLFRALISRQYSHKHHLTIKSKTGLMVAKAAALRIKIDTDRRPLSAKKRWRTSSKLCAPELLTADSLLRSNATVLGLPFLDLDSCQNSNKTRKIKQQRYRRGRRRMKERKSLLQY